MVYFVFILAIGILNLLFSTENVLEDESTTGASKGRLQRRASASRPSSEIVIPKEIAGITMDRV